ncbi:MAG: zinc ribbon domain-containing protein [Ruminiclostridium sp.]
MDAIITTLIVIGIIALAIFILVAIIKHKLNSVTRKYLNMGLGETADLISKGLKEETTTPKAISNLAAVYKPKLLRDFPETNYEQFEEMAKSSFKSILDSIEAEDTSLLIKASDSLTQNVKHIINDNKGKGLRECFDDLKIHRMSVSDYKNTSDAAQVAFEISFQCLHYFIGKKETDKTLKQLAGRITLICGTKLKDDNNSSVFTDNCPNCGAPIRSAKGETFCPYCGTGVTQVIDKIWLANSFEFI